MFFGIKLIFTYFLYCWTFFFQVSEIFFVVVKFMKDRVMGVPAYVVLSPKAEGGVIAGEGNCPWWQQLWVHQDAARYPYEITGQAPWMWDECRARQEREEGHQTSPSSTAHYPAWVSQPAWNNPSASPGRAWRSSCTRKPGISALKSRWLLAPRWGSPMSSRKDTSVSQNCLGSHASFRCPPRAPSPARCGAAVCLFSNWDCRDTPEDEKAQDRDRKAAVRRSPMEILHLLHLFLFCWYFNLSSKTSSKLQDLAWSFVFSEGFSAYHRILLCSRQCVLLGFFWHQATRAGAIGRLWYIKNR